MKSSRKLTAGSFVATMLLGVIVLLGCSAKNTKLDQYYVQGQMLYEKNCSNCHQKNGKGLGLVYPPLADNDYFVNHLDDSFCEMKYGKKGSILVNGKEYNKAMPGVPSLTELEIAEIATYLNNSWGRENGIVEIQRVKQALAKCNTQ